MCAVGIGFLIWVNRGQAARISDLGHDLMLLRESIKDKRDQETAESLRSKYRDDMRVTSWVDLDEDG